MSVSRRLGRLYVVKDLLGNLGERSGGGRFAGRGPLREQAQTSAKSCGVRSRSRPSGMSERPELAEPLDLATGQNREFGLFGL